MSLEIAVTGIGALGVGLALGFIMGYTEGFTKCQNSHKKDNGFAAMNRRHL